MTVPGANQDKGRERTLEELLAAGEVKSALILKGRFTEVERRIAQAAYEQGLEHGRARLAVAFRLACEEVAYLVAYCSEPEYASQHPDAVAAEFLAKADQA